MTDLILLLLFPSVVAVVLGGLITSVSPAWSLRRTILTAALPLPIFMALMCTWVFIGAAIASKESCGIDACGMAMMFSVVGFGYALAAFTIGAVAVGLIKRASLRR